MILEIRVPSVGESVREALLAQWFKHSGEPVAKDEPLFVIETDKVTLEVAAEADGVLTIQIEEGTRVAIGSVVGTIDAAAASGAGEAPPRPEKEPPPAPEVQPPSTSETEPAAAPHRMGVEKPGLTPEAAPGESEPPKILAPAARRLIAEKKLDVSRISGTGPGGRITKGDVLLYLESRSASLSAVSEPAVSGPQNDDRKAATGEASRAISHTQDPITRKPMSPIRRRIAERLLEARQNTAMVTTFNEIDMGRVQEIRGAYREKFFEKHHVNLGIMSFFIKASIEALREFPRLNASIDGGDLIEHHYYHVGVAVGSERGLVVPVIRHADRMSFAQLEQAIVAHVQKIEQNRLELADLEGGTFTISNGGVYGSLLSTPMLNVPQSGILGMHKIEKRAVVIGEEIRVRPMMYVALTYDHRIVDGREAVSFLKRIKCCVENPERIMMEI